MRPHSWRDEAASHKEKARVDCRRRERRAVLWSVLLPPCVFSVLVHSSWPCVLEPQRCTKNIPTCLYLILLSAVLHVLKRSHSIHGRKRIQRLGIVRTRVNRGKLFCLCSLELGVGGGQESIVLGKRTFETLRSTSVERHGIVDLIAATNQRL